MTDLALSIYSKSPIWMQNLACDLAGWQRSRLRYGGEFERWAAFYERSARWSEPELLAYQREQVRLLIRECFEEVPYYFHKWTRLKLGPSDFRSLDDLRRFPVVDRDDLYDAGDRLLKAGADKRKLVCYTTGGTTGMALHCWKSTAEIQRHYAIFWDRMRPGVRRGDRYATFQGKEVVPRVQRRPPFWRDSRPTGQRLYSMRHLSPERLESYARDLVETPFVYYQGYANFMALVAEHMADRGLTPRTPPVAVFSTSDQLSQAARQLMEHTWRTKVWDEYGMVEYAALIRECAQGNRHPQMDYGVIELEPVGREDGFQVAEVIATGFIPHMAPIVRYRVGDQVLVDPDARCACGAPGPVIKAIRGRTSEFIVSADGRRYPTITHFVEQLRHVRRTQVLQERVGEVTVRVVTTPQFSAEDARHAARVFEERLGSDMAIRIERVPELERMPNGKVLNIINRIPAEESGRLTAAGQD